MFPMLPTAYPLIAAICNDKRLGLAAMRLALSRASMTRASAFMTRLLALTLSQ